MTQEKHVEFACGDRVYCIARYAGQSSNPVGAYGTVTDGGGVVFDEDVGGHNLSGRCHPGHGWWYVPQTMYKFFVHAEEMENKPIPSFEELF